MHKKVFLLIVLASASLCQLNNHCLPRNYGQGSIVCVCNSTYCDTISTPSVPLHSVKVFQTSKSGQRFNFSTIKLSKLSLSLYMESTVITINSSKRYQTIKGFGGAITDAASINIKSLSQKTQQNLINSYYGVSGIEYNLGRVPMASCDYSTRKYTYLDTKDDFNLTTFALAEEDIMYKIPILKSIFSHAHKTISLYASPWTAPAWMKTNDDEIGRGWLKGKAGDKYHKTWAKYFTKFLNEYAKHGIKFWGLTVQNEPSNGLLVKSTWQSTGFTAQTERDFVKLDLGPELEQSGYGGMKLMILDDDRIFLPNWVNIVLSDPDAAKYVSGIGVHWYLNDYGGPELLSETHEQNPKYFILGTEACDEDHPGVNLGNWEDGVKYSSDILDNLNNWVVGWVDWNIALNLKGGPNWAKNYDDSPVIVNATADEFYKQPMFYHLGHFSKFIPEGSVKIHSESNQSPLKFTAVQTPSKEMVLVVLNQSSDNISFTVKDSFYSFNFTIKADTIATFVWN